MLNRPCTDSLLAGEGLRLVFQPIFNVSGGSLAPWGVEALTRGPANTKFESAPVLFDYLRLKHEEVAIDRRCVAFALAEAARFNPGVVISLNVHAATLDRDASFPGWVISEAERCEVSMRRLVFELVEQSQYWNIARVTRAIAKLRRAGARIAVDDVGCGHCNYRTIVEIRPDYLKLDRFFVQNCPTDRAHAAVVRSLQQLARDIDATVIAEGIETEEQLRAIRRHGLPLAQGFMLARPTSAQQLISTGAQYATAAFKGAAHVS